MGDEFRDSLLYKALAVDDIPEDFDPTKVPQTGEEYLHYVMYEAMNCDEYTTSHIKQEKFRNKQTLVTHVSTCQVIPQYLMFPEDWQDRKIADFSAFRLHIQKIKNQFVYKEEYKFNGEMKKLFEMCSVEPKLSDVVQLKQNHLTKILKCYVSWLKEPKASQGLSYSHNVWLYALLSCIETPIWPDTSSVIRDIARLYSKILSNLPESTTTEMITPHNLFLCIIVKYFNNIDLLDCNK